MEKLPRCAQTDPERNDETGKLLTAMFVSFHFLARFAAFKGEVKGRTIEDRLIVPNVTKGDYVLRWR
jgi:hypothetical protein